VGRFDFDVDLAERWCGFAIHVGVIGASLESIELLPVGHNLVGNFSLLNRIIALGRVDVCRLTHWDDRFIGFSL
jgi:hypothetical protein